MAVSIKPSDAKPYYDPKEFVVPAGDDKGHSTRMQFRCNPSYARRIDDVTSARRFPYKTCSDLLRHALHRHLEYLAELEPTIPLDMPRLELVNKIINERRAKMEFTTSLDGLSEAVNDYLKTGARKQAADLIREVLAEVERMVLDHWAGWCRQEVLRRFVYLLDGPV